MASQQEFVGLTRYSGFLNIVKGEGVCVDGGFSKLGL